MSDSASLRQVASVVRRLGARSQFVSIAREILTGMGKARNARFPPMFVGEMKKGTGCVKDGNEGKEDDTIFECAQNAFACIPYDKGMGDFDCATDASKFDCANILPGIGFDCESASNFTCGPNGFECLSESAYNNCGGSKNDFNCGESEYNCGGGGDGTDEKYFDCHDFNCKGTGGSDSTAFECDSEIDFICGEKYVCEDVFDCTAGHVFMCMLDHDCNDNFTCSADGTPACNDTYPYTNPPAGDFMCGAGVEWKGTDDLDCTDKFQCKAEDQFDCALDAKFDCGDGGEMDSFTCDTGALPGKFTCTESEDFNCNPVAQFECERGTDYDCNDATGKYTQS